MRYEDAVTALAAANNWHKATYSGGQNGGCVEVGSIPRFVGVRDTKLGLASQILVFTDAEWGAFMAGVKDDELNLK